jgi:penicillin-binding protein 1A
VLAALLALVFCTWVLWRRCGFSGCPNVERLASYQPGGATILLDNQGEKFADLAPSHHEIVKLETLPDFVPAAFVAVEDRRFYRHRGVDYRRVGGAVLANVKARGVSEGFSTITMQLARNVWPDRLPGQQRTIKRKILEVRVARDIEHAFDKKEILELYLNHIYFGEGSYGIEAASRNYFNKSARQLTLAEAATLAAMPKSPVQYNPRRRPERNATRRELVLTLMQKEGVIPAAKAEQAKKQRVRVRRTPNRPANTNSPVVAPYFLDALRASLEDEFGEDIYTSPLRVYTTLDRRVQRALEAQLERQASAIERGEFGAYRGARYTEGGEPEEETEYLQTAGIIMSADSGSVLALVGGRDYRESGFNRATQAHRQPGSAFKPFVFAAALGEGILPTQQIADSTLALELPGGEHWEPRNFGGENEDFVTLRDALVRSKNIPTIRLAADIGMSSVRRVARRSGVHSEIPDVPSVALGSAAVTPLELTQAYTPLATLGQTVEPRFFTRIEDADGNVVWNRGANRDDAIDPAVAYLVTDMLEDAVDEGTGTAVRRAGYRGTAAGKTGTTNDGADAWFVGYTPDYVATIWFGFDQPRSITVNASAGRLAAPVFGRLMRAVYGDNKARDWDRPEGVVVKRTDPATGLLLTEGCRPAHGKARSELFIHGTEPPRSCPAGEPVAGKPGVLRRIGSWFGERFHGLSIWLRRHVGSERPTRTPSDDRYLGTPRLPRAADVPQAEITPEEFDLPTRDSIQLNTIRLPIDSVAFDTLFVDPSVRDSVPPDTIIPDTMTPDTVPPDTASGPPFGPTE